MSHEVIGTIIEIKKLTSFALFVKYGKMEVSTYRHFLAQGQHTYQM